VPQTTADQILGSGALTYEPSVRDGRLPVGEIRSHAGLVKNRDQQVHILGGISSLSKGQNATQYARLVFRSWVNHVVGVCARPGTVRSRSTYAEGGVGSGGGGLRDSQHGFGWPL
jgi:hypothetical protein